MIDILVVDDHPIVRNGLKQMLSEERDIRVTGEAENGGEMLRLLEERKIDVIVMDLSLPDRNGLDLLEEVKTRYPEKPVLMLSIHREEHFGSRALKAGAAGYVNKRTAGRDLIAAIRKVATGGMYISVEMAERLAFKVGGGLSELPHESLSEREFQVFCMISEGIKLIDIAKELSLSETTVSTYRTRILKKMDMQSDSELIRYAVRNCLIED
ncbi:MAG: DNA-binding response regulator [Candidatus Solincola sediminis]|uniref:DNA-binding response regulator n=1 Tax=Candidatus Solincola sediminis TaxID=1797199 RepID=A0A1F2WM80_9ACTN|nr:MAG: DNA-binding response regulator [Candidatus Solincola sediminis]OFW58399.1 MAG: DNA-binding response regulator [Candidatus Solincola sediminis]